MPTQAIPLGHPEAPGGRLSSAYVYLVQFFSAPFPDQPRRKYFLFSSLAAVFEMFSPEQIGCGLAHLYNLKVPDGVAFAGKRCVICREKVFSKRHLPK